MRSPYAHNCTPIIICCQGVFLWYSMSTMRLILVCIAAITVGIGAQSIRPNATPPGTPESGSTIGKLDGEKKADESKQKNSEDMPSIRCAGCFNEEQPHGKSKEEQAKADSLDMLYRAYMWATIVGVVGAFIGLYLIWCQSRTSEQAANAASLNAQAVLNSERPWLVVTAEKSDKMGRPGYFFFRVTNKGRTPAQFISGGCGLAFKMNANELRIPPDYGPFLLPNNTFLPPDDSFDVARTETEGLIGMNPTEIIEQHFKGPDATYGDTLYFFGKIVYDDVLGKNRAGYEQHQTRWCFAFYKDGMRWVRSGPSRPNWWKYNRYT